MTNNNFVGTWKLIYWESKTPKGKIYHPFGKNTIGYITYTEYQHMSATIMKENRPNIEIPPEELIKARQVLLKPWLLINGWKYIKGIFRYLQASTNYISYSGKYEIKGNKVVHHVEVSLIPDWTGTDLERTFEFSSDSRLVLSTPDQDGNHHYLTWERI
ncbi:MAG: lipocalin-like domain-containing protein [Moorea sp. SIO3G5]|nr:lipocalin-like domain-containing protein [Moorena sp. SIO3G5]